MNRREFIKKTALSVGVMAAGGCLEMEASQEGKNQSRPNIMVITADDMGFETPGCFGNTTPDITPNIDKLADEGLKFEHAYVTSSICMPTRTSWISGRLPYRSGSIGFNPVAPGIPRLGKMMKEAGYYTGIVQKVWHFSPATEEDWDYIVDHLDHGGRDPKAYPAMIREFTQKAEKAGKPCFLIVNITDPHRAFCGSPKEQNKFPNRPPASRMYKPSEVDVPGYLPDVPAMREELSYYYNSSKRCDDSVGKILDTMDELGISGKETITMFLSDNGAPLPFAKGSVYRQSVQTPWIIRWPGKIKPGTIDDENFVNGVDFMPTILDLAGSKTPDTIDGKSFAPVLFGKKVDGFDFGFGVFIRGHSHFVNQRGIHTKKYGYIFNEWVAFEDGDVYFVADNMTPILYPAADRDPELAKRIEFYLDRAPEELYDYEKDPWATCNLVHDPEYFDALKTMRKKMIDWMDQHGDPSGRSLKVTARRNPKRKPVSDRNYMENGGFEDVSGNRAIGWSGDGKLTKDSASGKYAMKFADLEWERNSNKSFGSKRIAVDGGRHYGCWFKAKTVEAKEVYVNLRFFDAEGKFLTQSRAQLPVDYKVFKQLEIPPIKAPEKAKFMDFFVHSAGQSTGWVFIDDVDVREVK